MSRALLRPSGLNALPIILSSKNLPNRIRVCVIYKDTIRFIYLYYGDLEPLMYRTDSSVDSDRTVDTVIASLQQSI